MTQLELNLDGYPPDQLMVSFSGSVQLDDETTLLGSMQIGQRLKLRISDERTGDFVDVWAKVSSRQWNHVTRDDGDIVVHKIGLKIR